MSATKNYQRWEDADKLMRLVDRMLEKNPDAIAIDVETGYVGPDQAGISLLPFHPDFRLVSFQFTISPDFAIYVPIGHDAGGNMDRLGAARALWKICSSGLTIAHNFSFELQVLSRFFREVLWDDAELGEAVQKSDGYFPIKSDTMIEAYMLAEYETLNLKELTHRVLRQEQAEITTLFPQLAAKKKLRFLRFNALDSFAQDVIDYACDDVTTCIQLHRKHYPQVKDMLMFRTEIALTPVLCQMEKEGLALDWAEYLRQEGIVAEFRQKMNEELQQAFSERLGENLVINFGSPKQVAELLYDRLRYPVKERTETGARSTGEGALRAIAKKDKDVAGILTLREVSALLTRYLTKYLKEFRYAEDGRAHPNHNQAGAATGRLSVSGVSYQQWPKPYHFELRSGETYELNYRDFLIAPEGFRQIGYDFSQVELRMLAGMANEQALLKAFHDGVDIHRATASSMMKIPLEEVTKKQRAQGKTLNFAVCYGSGAANIGDMLGIPTEEAQELLDLYFETFSGLKSWMASKVVEGRQQRYVETLFGRKYRLWEYSKPERWQQSAGDRLCVNAPVQGGAADYMKLGMVRVNATIRRAEESGVIPKGSIRLVMTVHDALEFYVHESVSTQQVIDLINPAVSFPIPGHPEFPEIRADWHEGYRWGSVVEIQTDEKKQITGYALEDVSTTFPTIEEAYAYLAEHKKPNGVTKPLLPTVAAPEEDPSLPEAPEAEDIPMIFEEVSPMTAEELSWLDSAEPVREKPKEEFTPHELTLQLPDMPLVEPWEKFQTFVSERPGDTKLIISTPEGSFELGEFELSDEDISAIQTMLSGARILAATGV